MGLGVADKFHRKKLGTLFIMIIIYIAKLLDKKILWLTTDLDNEVGYGLYKKIGFEYVGNTEVFIQPDDYKRIEREMKLDLSKY